MSKENKNKNQDCFILKESIKPNAMSEFDQIDPGLKTKAVTAILGTTEKIKTEC